MRKPVREVNVFSVSALDLFASALGAFIVMSMIFMVFFSMTARDSGEDESLQAALEQCEANRNQAEAALAQCQANLDASADASELAQCQSELSGARAQSADLRAQLEAAGGATARLDEVNSELESCRRALKKTFVLVIASWSSTNDDVDLHVVDPQGREFYYGRNGTRAQMQHWRRTTDAAPAMKSGCIPMRSLAGIAFATSSLEIGEQSKETRCPMSEAVCFGRRASSKSAMCPLLKNVK